MVNLREAYKWGKFVLRTAGILYEQHYNGFFLTPIKEKCSKKSLRYSRPIGIYWPFILTQFPAILSTFLTFTIYERCILINFF